MSSNIFKNKIAVNVGTTDTDVYVSPTGKTATIIGLSLANTKSENIFVSVKLYDTSTLTTAYLIKNAPIPASGSLIVIGGDQKVILENGDKIVVVSDTSSSVDVVMSVMELVESV